jgi:hypothetical protein
MKKVMSLMLGLALVTGTVAFADEKITLNKRAASTAKGTTKSTTKTKPNQNQNRAQLPPRQEPNPKGTHKKYTK